VAGAHRTAVEAGAGGCHLTRPIADFIEKAGFEIERLDTYYLEGDLKPFGYTYEGHAISR
jgi:hypothetical protein